MVEVDVEEDVVKIRGAHKSVPSIVRPSIGDPYVVRKSNVTDGFVGSEIEIFEGVESNGASDGDSPRLVEEFNSWRLERGRREKERRGRMGEGEKGRRGRRGAGEKGRRGEATEAEGEGGRRKERGKKEGEGGRRREKEGEGGRRVPATAG
jgi:hypothetical protein